MKIHLIIEIEDDGKTRRATVERVVKVAELNGDDVLAINPADAPKIERKGSGPQFDPGFLKTVQDAPEPFTSRSIAVSSGLNVVDVTQRLIRLHKMGWIDQPAREMWRRTETFGEK